MKERDPVLSLSHSPYDSNKVSSTTDYYIYQNRYLLSVGFEVYTKINIQGIRRYSYI